MTDDEKLKAWVTSRKVVPMLEFDLKKKIIEARRHTKDERWLTCIRNIEKIFEEYWGD